MRPRPASPALAETQPSPFIRLRLCCNDSIVLFQRGIIKFEGSVQYRVVHQKCQRASGKVRQSSFADGRGECVHNRRSVQLNGLNHPTERFALNSLPRVFGKFTILPQADDFEGIDFKDLFSFQILLKHVHFQIRYSERT